MTQHPKPARFTLQATSKAGTTLVYKTNDPTVARSLEARLITQGYTVHVVDHEEDSTT